MAFPVIAVIPARLDSIRFAGKVLALYRGKPLLYHVWRQAKKASQVDRVLIATDSSEIVRQVRLFGGEAVMTSRRHRTGSDRAAQAVVGLKTSIVLNIQGDNLGLSSATLDRVIGAMKADRSIGCATLACRIRDDAKLFDPNVVKLICDSSGRAIWFSRYPLPYLQSVAKGSRADQFSFLAHIGVYFFRSSFLRTYAGWTRGRYEKAESLEQLRILENRASIKVFMTRAGSISIDTPEDLKKASRLRI